MAFRRQSQQVAPRVAAAGTKVAVDVCEVTGYTSAANSAHSSSRSAKVTPAGPSTSSTPLSSTFIFFRAFQTLHREKTRCIYLQTARRLLAILPLVSCFFFFPSRQLKKKKNKPIHCLFSAIQKRRCSWAVDFPGRLTELHHATCSGGEGTQEVPVRRQRLTEVFCFFFSPCHSFTDAALPAMLGQVTETASLESRSCRNNFKVSLLQSVVRRDCTISGIKIAFRITAKCIMTNLLGSWWRRQEKNPCSKVVRTRADKRLEFVFMPSVRCCSQAKNLPFVPIVLKKKNGVPVSQQGAFYLCYVSICR